MNRTYYIIARIACWGLSIILLYYGFFRPPFHALDGMLTTPAAFMIGLAISLAVLGWGIATIDKTFWAWLSLAIAGQAAALQLIDAGKQMGFQHYKPWDTLVLNTSPAILGILLLQMVLVLIGIGLNYTTIKRWISQHMKPWQVILVCLAVFLTGATVSAQINIFVGELILASIIMAVNLGNLVLILLSTPGPFLQRSEENFDRVFGNEIEAGASTSRPDRFILILASIVIAVTTGLSLLVYQAHPHIPDEVVYLYQARFLANGKLTLPTPPVPDAFIFYLMEVNGDRWYPVTPVGWPAMLAMGVKIGAPWIINPLLSGMNLILSYYILSQLYSRRLARIAVVMISLSPWFIFMGMNYMAHTFTLTCALAATWFVMLARKTGRTLWAVAAGLSIGVASLIRPLDGLIIAALLGAWSIGFGGKRLRWQSIAALVLTTGLVGGVVLPYNAILTGNPLKFPINVHTDRVYGVNSNAYGFGPDRGMGWPTDPNPGHSPLDGVINMQLNASSLNVELFGWACGSLWLALWFIVSGKYRKNDILLVAIILLNVGAYFFYYFSGGSDFGARYWYFVLIPLVVMTIRGIQNLSTGALDNHAQPKESTRLLMGIFIVSLVAVVNFFPWRAIDKYYQYLQMRPDLRAYTNESRFDESLVIVQGNLFPDYASEAAYNPLDFQTGKVVFARDGGPDMDRQLALAFPDRKIWIVAGPTLTGAGYRLVEGPISAAEFLAELPPAPE